MLKLMTAPPPQIPALTGLRFVAALMVMFGHTMGFYSGFGQIAYNALSGFANMGMSLFFVLSGFVITYNYPTLGSLRADELKRFAVARVARIYPLYLAVLALNVAIWTAGNVTPVGLLAHLTLTQDWFMHTVNGVPLISQFQNAHVAWSISAEWFCYLLFPAICLLLARTPRPLLAAVTVWLVLATFMYWIHGARPEGGKFIEWLGYYSPYARLGEFVIGCLTCLLSARLPAPGRGERRFVAPLLVSAAVAWLAIADEWFATPGGILSTYRWVAGYTPGAAVLIFCCARYGGSWLGDRWMVAAGDASYSFYMLHTLVTVAFMRWMPQPTDDPLLASAVIVAAIALNLAISLLIFRAFERPARNLVRRAFGLRRVAATS